MSNPSPRLIAKLLFGTGAVLAFTSAFGDSTIMSHACWTQVVQASDGSVYAGGYAVSARGDYDFLTAKYNSAGKLLGTQTYNDPSNGNDEIQSIALAEDGGIYAVGDVNADQPSADIVTIKYSSIGQVEWLRQYDGSGHSTDHVTQAKSDASGNLILVGSVTGFLTGADAFVLKYSPTGRKLWSRTRQISFNGQWAQLAIDSANEIAVTGWQNHESGSSSDGLTALYNSTGKLEWLRTLRTVDPNWFQASAVSFDPDNNVIVAGMGARSQWRVRLVKYLHDGAEQWRSTLGVNNDTYGYPSLAVDGNGNILLAYIRMGQPVDYVSEIAAVVSKFSPDGQKLWAKYHNSESDADSPYDLQASVQVDASGNVYLSNSDGGATSGTASVKTLKYDQFGNLIWLRRFQSDDSRNTIHLDLAVSSIGQVLVAGKILEGFSAVGLPDTNAFIVRY